MRTQIARSVGYGDLVGGRSVHGADSVFVAYEGVVKKCSTDGRKRETVCVAKSIAPLAQGYLSMKGGNLIYEPY